MKAVSGMESNYATAKVCSFKDATKCDLALEPGENYEYKIKIWLLIHEQHNYCSYLDFCGMVIFILSTPLLNMLLQT